MIFFFFFHFVGYCGEVALIITKILTLTLNSKWKSKILCIEKQKEKDRCSSQKKSCREQTGKTFDKKKKKKIKDDEKYCKRVYMCMKYMYQVPVPILSLQERHALKCFAAFFTLSPFACRNRSTQALLHNFSYIHEQK